MKIAIPTETGTGGSARLSSHLGQSPFFTIWDDQISGFEIIDRGPHADREHSHQGACGIAQTLAGRADAVACRGLGRGALQKLRLAKMSVFKAEGETVDDVINARRSGSLEGFDESETCPGHGHGEEK